MSQIWKNDKKPTFVTHFGPYGPNLGPQFFLAGFISTSSYTLFQAIIQGDLKEN